MNATGWEIKPLGWVVLAIVVGLTVYFLVTLRNENNSKAKENKI